jgi:hypothetical protein
MTVIGFQNQNMHATDDDDEFDKFDVKKLIQHRTQGTVCVPLPFLTINSSNNMRCLFCYFPIFNIGNYLQLALRDLSK